MEWAYPIHLDSSESIPDPRLHSGRIWIRHGLIRVRPYINARGQPSRTKRSVCAPGKCLCAIFFSCSPHPLLEKRPPPGGWQVRTHTRARAQWYLLIAARYVLPDALKRKKRISHAVVRGIEARTSARCRPSAATRPRAPGRCCTRTRTRPACSRSSLQCL